MTLRSQDCIVRHEHEVCFYLLLRCVPLHSVFSLSVTGRKLNLPLRVLVSILHIVSVMTIQLLFTADRFSVRIPVLWLTIMNKTRLIMKEQKHRKTEEGGLRRGMGGRPLCVCRI